MRPAKSIVLILLIFALAVVTLAVATCGGEKATGSTQGVTTSTQAVTTSIQAVTSSAAPLRHWAQDGVSLDWPEEWKLAPESMGEPRIEGLAGFTFLCMVIWAEPYYHGHVDLVARDLAPEETLQSLFDQTYAALPSMGSLRDVTEWSDSVSGLPAQFKSQALAAGEPWYQHWDAWLEYQGHLYVLAGCASAGYADEVRTGFDQIVRSFQVSVGQ